MNSKILAAFIVGAGLFTSAFTLSAYGDAGATETKDAAIVNSTTVEREMPS